MPRWLLLLPLLLSPAARADEIADAIAEAGRAHARGDVAATREALAEAQQFLAQRAAAGLAQALPAPLPGWTAERAESSGAPALFFGGGSVASRGYRNAAGQSVKIDITADSPMVAQLAMFLGSPAMVGTTGRLIRVGPYRAIQTNDGDLQMVIDSRVLVQVAGYAPIEAKLAYARAIDAARLTARR